LAQEEEAVFVGQELERHDRLAGGSAQEFRVNGQG
jgi:hypothetical protein